MRYKSGHQSRNEGIAIISKFREIPLSFIPISTGVIPIVQMNSPRLGVAESAALVTVTHNRGIHSRRNRKRHVKFDAIRARLSLVRVYSARFEERGIIHRAFAFFHRLTMATPPRLFFSMAGIKVTRVHLARARCTDRSFETFSCGRWMEWYFDGRLDLILCDWISLCSIM